MKPRMTDVVLPPTFEQTASFTPGPWTAREQLSKDRKSLGWIIEHQNGRIGWSSYATAEPNEGEDAPYPVGAANASLIAAAPELLAALEAIANLDGSYFDRAIEARVLARAAIAKAKAGVL